jgi:hypothetical protein
LGSHLAIARGETGTYDRDASLANASSTRSDLLGLLEAARSKLAKDLTDLEGCDMDEEVATTGRALPRGAFIFHAMGHAYEHVAQAEVAAQLWKQQRQG